ncbi:hypothetical protein [Agromyces cerinus]|uniref:Uncharacterized protein n=1 Tax=Agromyces cerinus subsp. cerinus TaxID=232089 RepID=A0A1N6I4X9_9MICO|nr:hypothetical protein [Agromyces cerinus]SIO27051.1 hypothetical protein SAMN05443544_3680 [Agromyces cerinus subsp. cerinus]
MSPEESAAVAAWVAAFVAIIFGGTGFIVGLVGLRHARQAKEAAAAANLIAKEANGISKKANFLSNESNEIAREANEISGRVSELSYEQHDVVWEWEFDSANDGVVTIQNLGKDEAHEVTIQFMFESTTEANPSPIQVAGREVVKFTIPTLRESIAKERAEERESARHAGSPYRSPHFPSMYRARLRVKWRTARGTPKQSDTDWTTAYLPT